MEDALNEDIERVARAQSGGGDTKEPLEITVTTANQELKVAQKRAGHSVCCVCVCVREREAETQ